MESDSPRAELNPQYLETRERQLKLFDKLGSDLLIMLGGVPRGEITRFRQNSDFFYLTGFPEHGAVLIIDPTEDKGAVNLFVRENTEKEQVWDGFTIGVEKTAKIFPADKVHNISELEAFLSKRLQDRRVHFKADNCHPRSELISGLLTSQNAEVVSSGEVFDAITDMRMVKSPLEISQMRKAIQITGEAHHACMRAGMRHRKEYQFEAEFEYHCKLQGVLHYAFGSIVAAGHHATCQHYIENAGPVGDNDLVLIDAGAVWNGYCADLTRTFPASGKFSALQRDLYETVLASEKAGVEKVAPGISMIDIHNHSARVLIDGLKDLGLMKGETSEILESKAYRDIWPGALCHSLGIDVHDVLLPGYHKGDQKLKPGMVITVEPGFYSQVFNLNIPEEFREIGIRIEDDVLVTEDGYENLSVDTVKEASEVEAMVQSGK
ncbi:MAG: aminopeptidase P family protein [Opitutales bacterium]